MGYVPEDAKWYLAEIVEQITVAGDPRNVVHTNLVLIRANSPDEAYDKSLSFGKRGETSYENPAGKRVNIVFRGLHDLNVIHDELEDGAELYFNRQIGMSEDDLLRWTKPKESLGVFAPIARWSGPDYAAAYVIGELYERFPHLRGTRPAWGVEDKVE